MLDLTPGASNRDQAPADTLEPLIAPPGEAGPEAEGPPPAVRAIDRVLSMLEVAFCSGFPTQLAIMLALAAAGLQPVGPDGQLSLRYVTLLSLIDTVVVLWLMLLFLRARGDSPRQLFLGSRRAPPEIRLGLALVPAVLGMMVGLTLLIQRAAPWMHDVPDNPLTALLGSGRDAAVFAVVVIVAGGVREELQRAFILDRFERHLGGAVAGLLVFSVAFGLGHLIQGRDAALITGVLGLVWGATYLWRRSVVAAVVCHAGFNLVQVLYHALAA